MLFLYYHEIQKHHEHSLLVVVNKKYVLYCFVFSIFSNCTNSVQAYSTTEKLNKTTPQIHHSWAKSNVFCAAMALPSRPVTRSNGNAVWSPYRVNAASPKLGVRWRPKDGGEGGDQEKRYSLLGCPVGS